MIKRIILYKSYINPYKNASESFVLKQKVTFISDMNFV